MISYLIGPWFAALNKSTLLNLYTLRLLNLYTLRLLRAALDLLSQTLRTLHALS